MPYPAVPVRHASTGPLAGLRFGVKDLFDVAGYPTSGGQPMMLALSGTQDPPRARGAGAAGRRRGLCRQDHHRRTGVFDERPERAFRRAGQRRRAGAHQRRLVVRFGRGRVQPAGGLRARQRHRRLGACTGQPLRAGRPAAHTWPHPSGRRDGPGAQPGHLRLVHARRAHVCPCGRRAAGQRCAAAAGTRAPALAARGLGAAGARGHGRAGRTLQPRAGRGGRGDAGGHRAGQLRRDVLAHAPHPGPRGLEQPGRFHHPPPAAAGAGRERAVRLVQPRDRRAGGRGHRLPRAVHRSAWPICWATTVCC